MSKRKILVVLLPLIFVFGLFTDSKAAVVGGVSIPDTYKVGNTTLVLNGAGARTKFIFIRIYIGALYVEKKSHNPKDIFAQPIKVIRMHFTYSNIPAKKIREAYKEDMENISKKFAHSEIAKKFMSLFSFPVHKGDNLDLIFDHDTVEVVYNGRKVGSIKSRALVYNVLSVYIGKHPTQSGLKKDLLGR